MENIVISKKRTALDVMMAIDSMAYLTWTNEERKESMNVLENAENIMLRMINSLTDDEWSERSIYKNNLNTLARYKAIASVKPTVIPPPFEHRLVEPEAVPDILENDDVEPNSDLVITMMILFWLLFFGACLVH